jgi:hypothetical protein
MSCYIMYPLLKSFHHLPDETFEGYFATSQGEMSFGIEIHLCLAIFLSRDVDSVQRLLPGQ